MIQRCERPKNKDFVRYGARGITVCSAWHKFAAFLADMGEAPVGLTLGRKNNEGPYCKENCRWETHLEQNQNKRTVTPVLFRGRTQTVAMWAREFGVPETSLRGRIIRLGLIPALESYANE